MSIDSNLVRDIGVEFNMQFDSVIVAKKFIERYGPARIWYEKYKRDRRKELSLPERYQAAGVTADEWISIVQQRVELRSQRSVIEQRRKKIVDDFKKKMADLENEENAVICAGQHQIDAVLSNYVAQLTASEAGYLAVLSGNDLSDAQKFLKFRVLKDFKTVKPVSVTDHWRNDAIEEGKVSDSLKEVKNFLALQNDSKH